MHRTVKRFTLRLLVLYLALILQALLGGSVPVGLITPELDLLVLATYALQGDPFQAMLLGFWSGLLRDSLTQGPPGGWALSLTLFSLALALRDKRIGLMKKTLLLLGATLGAHTFVFLLRDRAVWEGRCYLELFLQTLLPSACLTGIMFLLGIRLFQRWLSDFESTQTSV